MRICALVAGRRLADMGGWGEHQRSHLTRAGIRKDTPYRPRRVRRPEVSSVISVILSARASSR